MAELQLVAIGSLPPGSLDHLARFLPSRVGLTCRPGDGVLDPRAAYDAQRGQYDTRLLLPALQERAARSGGRVLGVADVDLYSAIFTFVFGESRLGGDVGLMSLHRLRPELYGLPADRELLRQRLEREALHEVGHLCGLVHCRRPDCVMRFSASVEEVDLKSSRFCPVCDERLRMAPPPLPDSRPGR